MLPSNCVDDFDSSSPLLDPEPEDSQNICGIGFEGFQFVVLGGGALRLYWDNRKMEATIVGLYRV